jgi:hypothetical protein
MGLEELNEEIKMKGGEIRQLKADGTDKAGLKASMKNSTIFSNCRNQLKL